MMLSDQVAAPLEKNKETISFPSLPLTPSRHIFFSFLTLAHCLLWKSDISGVILVTVYGNTCDAKLLSTITQ